MEERPRHGGVLSWGADAAAVLTSNDRAEDDHRKGRRSSCHQTDCGRRKETGRRKTSGYGDT
jgi:hypothetical protein